jgi:hypothetical protein
MASDLATLLDQIDELLALRGTAPREEIERALTDGYAHALGIEAERMRLERELGATAVALEAADGPQATRISEIARRIVAANEDLSGLRAKLSALRSHAFAVPASGPAAARQT